MVARRQHGFVGAVAAAQPYRSLLVQPLRSNLLLQSKTSWEPHDAVSPRRELWTRAIAVNEIVFDFDTEEWPRVKDACDRVTAVLDALGAPYLMALSGGKGVHIHTWIDTHTLTLPKDLMLKARRVDVCPWSVAREAIADAILDAAEFPKRTPDRYTKGDGEGIVDLTKIRWSAKRKGSMIRTFGCRGGRGFRKTLVDECPAELAPAPLRFPKGPSDAWAIPQPMADRVLRALRSRVDEASASLLAPPKDLQGVGLDRVPCVWKAMTEGVTSGSRHTAHLNLVSTCFRLGLSAEDAKKALQRAVDNHGLSEGDTVEKLVREVYEGRWRPPENLTCPSPHVTPMCDPNGCALSRHLSFS